jgi:ferrous iron transport protein A
VGVVLGVDLEFVVRERLAALGVRPGRRVRVIRRAPGGGPLQVRVGTTDLLLRADEAARIAVELAPSAGAGRRRSR